LEVSFHPPSVNSAFHFIARHLIDTSPDPSPNITGVKSTI